MAKHQSLWTKLRHDAEQLTKARLMKDDVSAQEVFRQIATNDSFQLLTLSRIRETVRRTWLPLPGANHLLRRAQTIVYGLEIGNEVQLGEGIDFVHPIGIVIGGNAVIGNRVRFMGNNTVGTAKENGYPIIEDDVTVGAGARILGPITVGRGSVIGANSVVVRDVPPDSVVTGIPGIARPKTRSASGEVV
jgi:serine O-acetyltransferase